MASDSRIACYLSPRTQNNNNIRLLEHRIDDGRQVDARGSIVFWQPYSQPARLIR